jgi:ComF family protein
MAIFDPKGLGESVSRSKDAVNLKTSFLVDGLFRRTQLAVLPPRCLLCGHRGAQSSDLCASCAFDIPRNDIRCARCALPLEMPAALCGECLKKPPAFDAAFVPFVYGHPLDLLMTKLKFGRSLAAGRVLSELWIDALKRMSISQPDILIPVPLHPSRLRERGYNQALELAKPLAKAIDAELSPNVLRRNRPTQAQIDLPADVRRRNLKGAFSVTDSTKIPPHVVVIDDVMTTGATLRECARVLKRAGAARVDVWALARAPAPSR